MNLPNKLSLMRIILVPIMAIVYLLPEMEIISPEYRIWTSIIAVVIFIVASFTDFLDGYIARKRNLVTDLGKLLDPIADKILVVCALFLIVEQNILPFGLGSLAGLIIVGREYVISIIRQIGASKNVIISANNYGKIKTVFQYISLPMLMLINIEIAGIFGVIFNWVAYITFGFSVFMALFSLIVYINQNKKIFKS